MLYTENNVLSAARNGTLSLSASDHLTPSARDLLQRHGIALTQEKAEHMTHLNARELVPKTHPRIAFRGKLDSLEAEILLCQKVPNAPSQALQEMLDFTRGLMRADVLAEPVRFGTLCSMTAAELRERSQNPQKYFGIGHILPTEADSTVLLHLNRLRTLVRETELQCCHAFPDREDMITALNRLSSLCWILCLQERTGKTADGKESGQWNNS